MLGPAGQCAAAGGRRPARCARDGTSSGMAAPMPGMNSGLDINNPAVVAAFRSALLHQGIAALLIFAVLSVAWVAVRDWRAGEAGAGRAGAGAAGEAAAEPAGRRVLRIGFGLLG